MQGTPPPPPSSPRLSQAARLVARTTLRHLLARPHAVPAVERRPTSSWATSCRGDGFESRAPFFFSARRSFLRPLIKRSTCACQGVWYKSTPRPSVSIRRSCVVARLSPPSGPCFPPSRSPALPPPADGPHLDPDRGSLMRISLPHKSVLKASVARLEAWLGARLSYRSVGQAQAGAGPLRRDAAGCRGPRVLARRAAVSLGLCPIHASRRPCLNSAMLP